MAWVIGVPDGVARAPPGAGPVGRVGLVVVVGVGPVEVVGPVDRIVVRADGLSHGRQQRTGASRLVGCGQYGVGLRLLQERDDLRRARSVPAPGRPTESGVEVSGGGVADGLEEARRAGVAGSGLPAPDDRCPPAASHAAPLMAGMRAVSAGAPRSRARWPGASCTRKLAWLTMTCAGSLSTLVMLREAGCSSNRGVLVSTLI